MLIMWPGQRSDGLASPRYSVDLAHGDCPNPCGEENATRPPRRCSQESHRSRRRIGGVDHAGSGLARKAANSME